MIIDAHGHIMNLGLGRLQAEMFRAVRLVVDTGMHDQRWTREEAIAYMLDNSAESETQSTAEAERYIAWPGQALAYKIGELKIKELRAKGEQHPIEATGRELRKLMSWVKSHDSDYTEGTAAR